MSPPLSRAERDKPPLRKKSCFACVKAKRRCDQKSPACLRCAQRSIHCEYPHSAPVLRGRRPSPEPQSAVHLELEQNDDEHELPRLSTTGCDFYASVDGSALGTQLSWPGNLAHLVGDEPSIFQLCEETASTVPELLREWPLTAPIDDVLRSGRTPATTSPTLQTIPVDMAFTQTARACDIAMTGGSFNMEAIRSELNYNLAYAVERIKSAPKTMLLELQAPWCHPSLYKDEIPRAMQDALSACALYQSRNAVNGPTIMCCIEAKLNDLLGSQMPTDLLRAVARLQALLLYQVMRFFDGDALARSSADATFNELQSSAHALAAHIIWDESAAQVHTSTAGAGFYAPFTSIQASRRFWKDWILQESARRTFLIACFFMSVWRLLTGRQTVTCADDPVLLGQSWTLSAHLWQAADCVDFAKAWRERRHYVVRRRAIISTLADANGDDIEEFGKMLLTVSMGIVEAKAWLAIKGTSLRAG